MMKLSGIIIRYCVALIFALTSVSAVQRLKSIRDLKRINFGQSVSKHSLVLLYWFANRVDIDYNDAIRLNFNPNRDFGSHHYGNYEGMLDPLPWGNGYQYYRVGSLNQDASARQLPHYVVHSRREYMGNNRDRIIIRVRDQIIDQVYITQHIEDQAEYDPAHTYRITTNLLRQIREFSVEQNQQSLSYLRNHYASDADVSTIRNNWANLAGLGLLLYIVIQEGYSSNQYNNRPAYTHRSEGNYRPEYNYRPQRNDSVENRRNDWAQCGRAIGIFLLVLFIVGLFILGKEGNRWPK